MSLTPIDAISPPVRVSPQIKQPPWIPQNARRVRPHAAQGGVQAALFNVPGFKTHVGEVACPVLDCRVAPTRVLGTDEQQGYQVEFKEAAGRPAAPGDGRRFMLILYGTV